MAVTALVKHRSKSGNWYENIVEVTFDTSYPIGGEALTAANCGFSDLATELIVIPQPTGRYYFEYDKANAKLKAFVNGQIGLDSRTITLTDDDNAATAGIAIYAHIDEVIEQGSFLAHIECATAGNADAGAQLYTSGPWLRIQDDDNASTGGLQIYFDEDATSGSRILADLDNIGDANVFVMASDGSLVKLDDTDTPSTPGVAVYFDDDAATATARLLFVSPTNASGTEKLHVLGGGEPLEATDMSTITAVLRVLGRKLA